MKKIIILLCLITLIIVGCTKNIEIKQPIETDQQKEQTENTEKETTNTETAPDKKIVMSPDFELQSMDGTMIKLSDLRGKNVIINFWATWCDFCVLEMPDLQKLQDTYKDDLIILAVNVGEKKEEVEKFIKDNNFKLTVLLDTDSSVSSIYGLRSFPSTISVNEKGEVVSAHVGMMTYEQMEKLYGLFEE